MEKNLPPALTIRRDEIFLRLFMCFAFLYAPFESCANTDQSNPIVIEKFHQDTTIFKNGTFRENLLYVSRITTQVGLDDESNHEYEYRPDRESLRIVEAYTITPTGKRIAVKREWIKESADVSKDGKNFDSIKKITIVFPEVSIGSRLFSRTQKTVFNPPDRKRFSDYSSLSSNYIFESFVLSLKVPKKFNLYLNVDNEIFQGGIIKENSSETSYRFKAVQLDRRNRNKGEIDPADYSPRLLFTTYGSYIEIGQHYEKNASPKSRTTKNVKKLADQITSGIDSDIEKIRAIRNWVTKNIRYISTTVADGGFIPRDVEYILAQRFGDCKDYVVVMQSLLKAVGIQSSPALINQGLSHTLRDGPAVLKPLNHVILYIPSEDLYLDPTLRFATFGVLNDELLDKPVVLTSLNRLGRTPKMSAEDNRVTSISEMTLTPDGSIQGNNESVFFGTLDIDARYDFADKEKDPLSKTISNLLYRFNEVGTGAISYTPPQDTTSSFRWNSSFNLVQVADLNKRGAFSLPVGIAPAFIGTKTTYLPSPKHSMPHVCLSYSAVEELKLHLPPGVSVEQIPTDLSFDKDYISYRSTYKLEGNLLYSKRELRVSRPSMVCSAGDFDNWLEALDLIRADYRSKIHLVSVTP
jgi:transglutaminase-like putative cysteine protease